jgi:hypothetical protein
MLMLVSASFSTGQAQTGAGVEGTITIGPAHAGPTKLGEPGSKPFANATFEVKNESGVVTSFTTDDQGRFQVSLVPGHYTAVQKGAKPAIGHFGPFDVDVVAGKITKVEWECDSGAR